RRRSWRGGIQQNSFAPLLRRRAVASLPNSYIRVWRNGALRRRRNNFFYVKQWHIPCLFPSAACFSEQTTHKEHHEKVRGAVGGCWFCLRAGDRRRGRSVAQR